LMGSVGVAGRVRFQGCQILTQNLIYFMNFVDFYLRLGVA
jgi:hypothetical protein